MIDLAKRTQIAFSVLLLAILGVSAAAAESAIKRSKRQYGSPYGSYGMGMGMGMDMCGGQPAICPCTPQQNCIGVPQAMPQIQGSNCVCCPITGQPMPGGFGAGYPAQYGGMQPGFGFGGGGYGQGYGVPGYGGGGYGVQPGFGMPSAYGGAYPAPAFGGGQLGCPGTVSPIPCTPQQTCIPQTVQPQISGAQCVCCPVTGMQAGYGSVAPMPQPAYGAYGGRQQGGFASGVNPCLPFGAGAGVCQPGFGGGMSAGYGGYGGLQGGQYGYGGMAGVGYPQGAAYGGFGAGGFAQQAGYGMGAGMQGCCIPQQYAPQIQNPCVPQGGIAPVNPCSPYVGGGMGGFGAFGGLRSLMQQAGGKRMNHRGQFNDLSGGGDRIDYRRVISQEIRCNKVIVFGQSPCKSCQLMMEALVNALTELNRVLRKKLDIFAFDFVNYKDADQLFGALSAMTSAFTVPQVFICGDFVGGAEHTHAAIRNGTIRSYLERCVNNEVEPGCPKTPPARHHASAIGGAATSQSQQRDLLSSVSIKQNDQPAPSAEIKALFGWQYSDSGKKVAKKAA